MHWRECECGSRTDEGEHDMEWTVITEATKETPGTEQGVCKVCGYTTQREAEHKGMSLIVKILLGLVILAVILGAAWFILNTISNNKRRKRRRSRRSSGGYINRSESSRRSNYRDSNSDYSGHSRESYGGHSGNHSGGSHSSHEHYEPRHGRHDGSSYDQWDDSRWGDR